MPIGKLTMSLDIEIDNSIRMLTKEKLFKIGETLGLDKSIIEKKSHEIIAELVKNIKIVKNNKKPLAKSNRLEMHRKAFIKKSDIKKAIKNLILGEVKNG